MKISLILRRVFLKGFICFELPGDISEKEILKQFFTNCNKKYGDLVKVTFDKPYANRTTGRHSQNNRIYGFVSQIARETGNDTEDIKEYCKIRAMVNGYPPKKNDKGEAIISLITGEPIPESSANVNTVEASYLINEIERLAAELGIILVEE